MRDVTRWFLAAALVLAPACGGNGSPNKPDGGLFRDANMGPDAAVTGGEVTGTAMETFVTDNGTQDVPIDLSGSTIAALVVDNNGQFTTYPGTGTASGTFSIPNVPAAGNYYLQDNSTYIITSARQIDLGRDVRGRSDQTDVTSTTQMTFNVSNMTAWTLSDFLELYSPQVGASFSYPSALAKTPPSIGATSLSFTVDYSLADNPIAIDSAKGDTAFVTHFAGTSNADGSTTNGLSEIANLDPFSITAGQPVTVSGSFQAVPQNKTAHLDYKVTQFQAIIDASAANAPFSSNSLSVLVEPGDASLGNYASSPSLATYDPATPPADATVDVTYGDPYPASWTRFVEEFSLWNKQLTVQGMKANAFGYIEDDLLLANASGQSIAPVVQPPAGVTIAGMDASGGVSGVGTTPQLKWQAVNRATFYDITVWELTVSGSSVSPSYVASIHTPDTDVTVPPKLLQTGKQYYVTIDAVSEPNTDVGTAPYRQSFPYAVASFISGVISP